MVTAIDRINRGEVGGHARRRGGLMTAITAVRVHDVRFPTSVNLDGSDAMNKDADYSAAYVVLETDAPGLSGYGLTFTIGRGNDIVAEAARQWALPLVGRDVEE